jgi:putative acetyltransferase
MEKFTFRPATNHDRAAVITLVKNILSEFNLDYSPDSSDADLTDIEKTYQLNGGLFEIIENENKEIIGTAALYRVEESTCMLRKMYLDKNYRNLGLGKKILERILSRAKKLGFKEIILETNTRMAAAIHLYEKYGFKVTDEIEKASPRCNLTMKMSF